jgi:hypothetical protein
MDHRKPGIERQPGTSLLPAELDNSNVIFSYGSLLDHDTLRELLRTRGAFEIFETVSRSEAVRLANRFSCDITILKNVRLEDVRVSLVTETILRRWYRTRGQDLTGLIDAGITAPEVSPAVFLYGRCARPGERGRFLNGGLICNLTAEEVSFLDRYEWTPVLSRVPVPRIVIEGRVYFPEAMTFYAGSEDPCDLEPEEKAERSRFLNLHRRPGRLSPQARWPPDVRRRFD